MATFRKIGMTEPTPSEEKPTCVVCKLCVRALPDSAPGRYRGKSWTCRHCLSLETMLYRHIGGTEKQGWTVESRGDFFKKAASLETSAFTWETVRTMIIDTQATRHVKEQINKVKAKSLPLSVWVAKGYEESAVKQFPAETDPHLGQLYAVPVKETSLAEIKALIHEELQKKEKEAVQDKNHKRKEPADTEEAPWDVVLKGGTESAGAPKMKKGKEAALTSAAAKAKAEKALKQETVKANKANEQMMLLAAKGAALLAKLIKSSNVLSQQAEKAKLEAPDKLDDLQKSIERGEQWNKSCVDALPLATAAKGTGACLPTLPFNGKDLQDYSKATTALQQEIRQALKALKEKEKGGSKAKEADGAAAAEK